MTSAVLLAPSTAFRRRFWVILLGLPMRSVYTMCRGTRRKEKRVKTLESVLTLLEDEVRICGGYPRLSVLPITLKPLVVGPAGLEPTLLRFNGIMDSLRPVQLLAYHANMRTSKPFITRMHNKTAHTPNSATTTVQDSLRSSLHEQHTSACPTYHPRTLPGGRHLAKTTPHAPH